MALFIYLAWPKSPKEGAEVECLYTGPDGAKGQALAELAAETNSYARIGRVTHPMVAPMAVTSEKTIASGVPEKPKRKAADLPKVKAPEKSIVSREDQLAEMRKSLRPTVPQEPSKAPERKLAGGGKDNGPTLEEWRERGYTDEGYPPLGYKAKDSKAYQEAFADGKLKKEEAIQAS